MNQTLLSLAGLLIVTLLSFAQQQTALRAQQQAVRGQVRQMAVGVAKQSMEVVRARAFDNATVAGTPSVSNLTRPGNFPSGKDCRAFGGSDRCDAIEDFHEMAPGADTVSVPNGTFRFEIEIDVHYVDSNMKRTTSRTERKEVTVRVRDNRGSDSPLLPQPIVFSEVMGYVRSS